jgi:periplasmic protein TonB
MIRAVERNTDMPKWDQGGQDRPKLQRVLRKRIPDLPAGMPRVKTLILHFPPTRKFGGSDLGWAGAVLFTFGLLLYGVAHLPSRPPALEETVEWVEETLPPPIEDIQEPPKPPPPPPPDPDVAPPPVAAVEAPPIFGIPEEATSEAGDMAVAMGNSLRVKADSVVQVAPPPLAGIPVELDQTPAFRKQVVAEYPEWAQDQGVEARVLVWVTIDSEGQVTEAKVKKGAGREFDPNALEAARASLFQPLVRDGRRMPSRFIVTYDFRLDG